MRSRQKICLLSVTAALLVIILGQAIVAGQAGGDLDGHWAKATINRWISREIMQGYPDGSFKPDAPIKRAEFAALINRTFGYTAIAAVKFTDMDGSEWFAPEIGKAVAAGYMNGYPDGSFRPQANIARQEAAVVLARIAGLKDSGGSISFSDRDSIPGWSRPAIAAVAGTGLITGYPDGSFRPGASITRAETATILDRFIAEIFREEGTHGTVSERTVVNGNAIILAEDVELFNYHIKGDLYIAESVGEGTVVLEGVKVDGRLVVNGGGTGSVVIKDSTVATLIIDKTGVRVVVQDDTQITEAYIMTSSKIEQNDNSQRIKFLFIEENEGEITLSGGFGTVSVKSESGKITLKSGHIDNLIIESAAKNVLCEIAETASVKNVVLNAPAKISGTGAIETAVINVDGVVIEQQPARVILAEDVTATVAGKKVFGPPSDDSSSGSGTSGGSGSSGGGGGSDDDKPSHVKVKSIQVTPQTMLLQVGRTGSIKVTVMPANASNKKVIWTSSDPGIATVDGSGKVSAVSPGVAVITAASAENTNIKASCIVTVTEYNVISNMLQLTIEAR
jgi:uncharacterized protein YjdB